MILRSRARKRNLGARQSINQSDKSPLCFYPQSCPARHLQKHLLSAIWPITSFSQPVKIKHSKQLKPWNVMPNHDAKLTWGRNYYCKPVSTFRVKFGPPPPPPPPPIKIPGSAPVVIFYDITTELEKVGPTVLYILPGHS